MNLTRSRNRDSEMGSRSGRGRGLARADVQRDSGLHPLARLRDEMDRLFQRFVGEPMGLGDSGEDGSSRTRNWMTAWQPSIEVAENDNEIIVRAELPGVNTDDVNVSVSGNELTISGEKREFHEETGSDDNTYYCERRYGSFRRSIDLPSDVDAERITAESHNGVMTIHVPRSEKSRRRHIEVRASNGHGSGGERSGSASQRASGPASSSSSTSSATSQPRAGGGSSQGSRMPGMG